LTTRLAHRALSSSRPGRCRPSPWTTLPMKSQRFRSQDHAAFVGVPALRFPRTPRWPFAFIEQQNDEGNTRASSNLTQNRPNPSAAGAIHAEIASGDETLCCVRLALGPSSRRRFAMPLWGTTERDAIRFHPRQPRHQQREPLIDEEPTCRPADPVGGCQDPPA